MSGQRWPDFLVIGAGKCGTTSLYHYLKQHPDVFLPTVKETNFFALAGHRPRRPEDDPEGLYYWPEAVTDERAYADLFLAAKPHQRCGEVSPMYLYSRQSPDRIRRALPDVRLIVILRDPAERLWSRYLHLVRDGRAPEGGIEAALDMSTVWWRRQDLVPEGRYHTHLRRYYDQFPADQIKVFLHSELKRDPTKLMRALFTHIGVSPDVTLDLTAKHNPSGTVARPWLHGAVGGGGLLPRALRSLSPTLWQWGRENPLAQRWVTAARSASLERPALRPHTRTRLIEEVYSGEIERLAAMLGRDLSPWLA